VRKKNKKALKRKLQALKEILEWASLITGIISAIVAIVKS
jgi:hypothetical protein